MTNNNLFGSWAVAHRRLRGLNSNVRSAMRTANMRNAVALRDGIKRKITEGDSSWPPISPFTQEFKQSSKPLMDHGDLRNSIAVTPVGPDFIHVGVPTTKGRYIVNIATVHEFGAFIRPRHARALALPVSREAARLYKIFKTVGRIPGLFHPKGTNVLAMRDRNATADSNIRNSLKVMFVLRTAVRIPARSFIGTTFREMREVFRLNIAIAVKSVLAGRRAA